MPDIASAIANYATAILIVCGAVLFVKLLLLIWFVYEMISINRNTRRTADAVERLASFPRPRQQAPQGGDWSDELMKCKALLDTRAITPEEYDFKKSQILGRGVTSYVDISSN